MKTIDEKANEFSEYVEKVIHRMSLIQSRSAKGDVSSLSLQERRAISFIGKNGACIMREVADHLMVAVSTMTNIVDKLVQKDLVVRDRSDKDRRIVKVSLLDKGVEVFNNEKANSLELSKGLLLALDDEEQNTLINIAKKLLTQDH
ncbi:MAG: DNA-binding MarR family transcriptional regulator [bacterium]|jgi:DNA-binding MarR family transcriptional regulator